MPKETKSPSSRVCEKLRRQLSKDLAVISYAVVSKPLTFEQLASLVGHAGLMRRILKKDIT